MPGGSSSGNGISLLTIGDQVCPWLGSTDGFKLDLNYAPGFAAQHMSAAIGYQTLAQHVGILPRNALYHPLRMPDKSLHPWCNQQGHLFAHWSGLFARFELKSSRKSAHPKAESEVVIRGPRGSGDENLRGRSSVCVRLNCTKDVVYPVPECVFFPVLIPSTIYLDPTLSPSTWAQRNTLPLEWYFPWFSGQ